MAAAVVWVAGSRVGIHTAPERGEYRLSCLGIQVAVDPNHSEHRGRDVKPAPLAQRIVVRMRDMPGFHRAPPEGHGALEIADRMDPGRVQQERLRPCKLVGVGLAGGDQDTDRRH